MEDVCRPVGTHGKRMLSIGFKLPVALCFDFYYEMVLKMTKGVSDTMRREERYA